MVLPIMTRVPPSVGILRRVKGQVNEGLTGRVQPAVSLRGTGIASKTSPCWTKREAVPAAGQDFPKGCTHHGRRAHTEWIGNEKSSSRLLSATWTYDGQGRTAAFPVPRSRCNSSVRRVAHTEKMLHTPWPASRSYPAWSGNTPRPFSREY